MKDVPATKDKIVTGRIVPSLYKKQNSELLSKIIFYMETISWMFLYQVLVQQEGPCITDPPKVKLWLKSPFCRETAFIKDATLIFATSRPSISNSQK